MATRAARARAGAAAPGRRGLFGLAAGFAVATAAPRALAEEEAPKAAPKPEVSAYVQGLIDKSAANKEMHDAQRLATSGANFARSRTVTDGTCGFPNNFIGCENLSEDLDMECKGTDDGDVCKAKVKGSFPSFLGL